MLGGSAPIHAVDVLNWDYLNVISSRADDEAITLSEGLAIFAHDFISTADDLRRDMMLAELLLNATAHQSKETAEKVVARLAAALKSDLVMLRSFAKQAGVRLKKN
jgi:hypothetical protein